MVPTKTRPKIALSQPRWRLTNVDRQTEWHSSTPVHQTSLECHDVEEYGQQFEPTIGAFDKEVLVLRTTGAPALVPAANSRPGWQDDQSQRCQLYGVYKNEKKIEDTSNELDHN